MLKRDGKKYVGFFIQTSVNWFDIRIFGQYFIITEITRYREDGRPEVRDFSNYPKKFRNYKIVKFIAVLSISIGFFLQAISVYALLASI